MENNDKQEILTAISGFAQNVQDQFDEVKRNVQDQFDEVKRNVQDQFDEVKRDITKIQATMVTKEYLDDKLSDLRGDLVVMVRKEDQKLGKLVEILQTKKVISEQEVKEVYSMEPFAKLK